MKPTSNNHKPKSKFKTQIINKSFFLIFMLLGMNVIGQTSTRDGLWNDAANWDSFLHPAIQLQMILQLQI